MKKPRPESPLKSLPPDRQRDIIDHMRENKLVDTCAWLRADGIRTSKSALSEFWSWWHLRQQFSEWEEDSQTMLELLKQEMPAISEEQLAGYGNAFFQMRAIKEADPKTYIALMSARHRAQMDARTLELREQELQLSQRKFQRETAELFLKWAEDRRALELASAPDLSHEQKVEQLGTLLFGEEWE